MSGGEAASALAGPTDEEASALAHRALVTAMVLGLVRVRPGLQVRVGELAAIAGAPGTFDLTVMIDRERVADEALATTFAKVREGVGAKGLAALMIGSPVTEGLVSAAREALATTSASVTDATTATAARLAEGRADAYGRALAWATERARAGFVLAPALDPDRLLRIAQAAEAAGLVLVEAPTAVNVPALAAVRGFRSARARALFATVAVGSSAWSVMLVPAAQAPKAGLARPKLERLAEGWVAPGLRARAPESDDADAGLVGAACAVLDERAHAGRGALSFKELLREARERWTSLAAARGRRAVPSASDATTLAGALSQLAADEHVTVHAVDPADPGWSLTVVTAPRD